MFMDICEVLARRATCFRGNSGALVVSKNDIISTGYNGPPSGMEHCKGEECELTPAGGCLRSLHAEQNAIDRALIKTGVYGGFDERKYWRDAVYTLYTLHSPCEECARAIIHSCGISTVYYRHPYRLIKGLDLISKTAISLYRITQSGMIIDYRTNKLILTEGDRK